MRVPYLGVLLLLLLTLTACETATPNASSPAPTSRPVATPTAAPPSALVTISGIVCDTATGGGVAGASISIGDQTTLTDNTGHFAVQVLRAARYALLVSSAGYLPDSSSLVGTSASDLEPVILLQAVGKLRAPVTTSNNGPTITLAPPSTLVSALPHGPLHVQDNLIVDSVGHPFWLRGAMIEGPNIADPQSYPTVQAALRHLNRTTFQVMHQQWHMNALRLPLSIQNWQSRPDYLTWIARIVQQANGAGLLVVLDLHAGTSTQGYPYPDVHLPTPEAIPFWTAVARRFKDNPHVMFDLFNEPDSRGVPHHLPEIGKDDWDVWLNGGTQNGHPVVGMQDLVNAIRAVGAQQIIMVEGLGTATTFHGIGLDYVQDQNIVYEIHPYFDAHSSQDEWDYNFGFLTSLYPVYAGEWGILPGFVPSCRYVPPTQAVSRVNAILNYFDTQQVSWTAYAFMSGYLFQDADYTHFAPTLLNVHWICGAGSRTGGAENGAGMGLLVEQHLRKNS